jgi:hypothetical protein
MSQRHKRLCSDDTVGDGPGDPLGSIKDAGRAVEVTGLALPMWLPTPTLAPDRRDGRSGRRAVDFECLSGVRRDPSSACRASGFGTAN